MRRSRRKDEPGPARCSLSCLTCLRRCKAAQKQNHRFDCCGEIEAHVIQAGPWRRVRNATQAGYLVGLPQTRRRMSSDTPTTEELERVAAYWRKVAALVCEHPSITFGARRRMEPTCEKCDRPVRMMSDIQIENLRNPDTTVVGAQGVKVVDS